MSNKYKQGEHSAEPKGRRIRNARFPSGTGTLIKIAFRNIGRNKRRTAFCLCAVALAVFFIPVYSSLIDGMVKSIDDITQIFELGHVNVVSKQYEAEKEYMPVQYPIADGKNRRELEAEIQAIPGVVTVLPRITAMATLQETTIKHATLWGLDLARETGPNAVHHFNIIDKNDGLVKGRWPRDANECAVGIVFENKSGLSIGDRIPLKTISAQFSDKMWSPEIVGVFNFDYYRLDERYIIADINRLDRLLVMEEGAQSFYIFTDDAGKSAPVAARVGELLGDDAVVSDWQENYWVAMMKLVMPIYTIIFMVFLIVASFLIVNTVVMIIHERIKEIGMMGSLGMTRVEIVTVFFFESIFLAVIGALIGVIVSGTVVLILQNFPFRFIDLYGNTFADMPLGNTIFFQFSFARLIYAFCLGVGIASVFTLIPSLRSARVEPVEALRR